MFKPIGVLVLLMVSGSVQAEEWVKIVETKEGTVYTSINSIEISSDNIISMWELLDFKEKQSMEDKRFASIMAKVEDDCKNVRQRVMMAIAFSAAMGGGYPVYITTAPGKWEAIDLKNRNGQRWEAACRQ